jgi:inosine-uridine nucleoside N-ribohydrolase
MPEVPVYRGVDRPIARSQVHRGMAIRIHGDLLDLPPVSHGATLQDGHAVDWLIETYLASDGDIVLCPVGPLTNIAMAIQKEPRIVDAIPEIVIMGGAHDHGNMTPSAEFNIWLDPEAARIVVNCGRPIRMVPLDATHRALVSSEDAARLRALGTPAGEAAARFVLKRIDGYDATQPMPHRGGAAPVHDALAVCAIIDPSILTTEHIPVDVEVHAELSAGRTVCDFRFRGGKPANVHFAMDADEPKFNRMLLDILGRTA